MTVNELFDHFSCWFEKIYYFDKTNNIEDVSYIINNNEDFMNEYGGFYVDDWEYDNTGDCMTIRISKDFK